MGEEYAEFHADREWIYDFVVDKFCVPAEWTLKAYSVISVSHTPPEPKL